MTRVRSVRLTLQPFWGACQVGKDVVSIYGRKPVRTGIDLKKDRRRLADLLTRGWKIASRGLKAKVDADHAAFDKVPARQLLQLGLKASDKRRKG
jgi:hypothetical protein